MNEIKVSYQKRILIQVLLFNLIIFLIFLFANITVNQLKNSLPLFIFFVVIVLFTMGFPLILKKENMKLIALTKNLSILEILLGILLLFPMICFGLSFLFFLSFLFIPERFIK